MASSALTNECVIDLTKAVEVQYIALLKKGDIDCHQDPGVVLPVVLSGILANPKCAGSNGGSWIRIFSVNRDLPGLTAALKSEKVPGKRIKLHRKLLDRVRSLIAASRKSISPSLVFAGVKNRTSQINEMTSALVDLFQIGKSLPTPELNQVQDVANQLQRIADRLRKLGLEMSDDGMNTQPGTPDYGGGDGSWDTKDSFGGNGGPDEGDFGDGGGGGGGGDDSYFAMLDRDLAYFMDEYTGRTPASPLASKPGVSVTELTDQMSNSHIAYLPTGSGSDGAPKAADKESTASKGVTQSTTQSPSILDSIAPSRYL